MSNNNFLTLMDQFFDDGILPATRRAGSAIFGSMPALNIKEFSDRYEITLTAPGIEIEKARVEIREKILTIRYETESAQSFENEDKGELIRQEFSEELSFTRSVSLPKNVEDDNIKATYKKGILKIVLKKIPETKPKNVQIHSED
jgi:HSP20 family protein